MSVFEKLPDDLDLGSDVWLRWTHPKDKPVDGALIFHKTSEGKLCGGSISLKNDPDGETRDTWEFNGDYEKPTLSPSVLCHCKFHGYVREGKWVSA